MTILDAATMPVVRPATVSSGFGRAAFLMIVTAAALAAPLATSDGATSGAVVAAGADLTHLLRFMAALKGAMAVAAVAAVWWRLGASASPVRLLAYMGTAACMVAGPGLIWGMAHVGWGALLLHGGLAATLLILWFDPATAGRPGAGLGPARPAGWPQASAASRSASSGLKPGTKPGSWCRAKVTWRLA